MTTTAYETSSRRCVSSDPAALLDRLAALLDVTEDGHD